MSKLESSAGHIGPLAPNLPLPSVYGVYAVSNGQLTELNALAVNVPDQRISISSPIASPSRSELSDGRVFFVAFQCDLVASAPKKVTIRLWPA